MKNGELMKWHEFNYEKIRSGEKQKMPDEKKWVFVQIRNSTPAMPDYVAVGYLRYSAGDKSCPYFVIPGLGGLYGAVVYWSDFIPEGFVYPGGNNELDHNFL